MRRQFTLTRGTGSLSQSLASRKGKWRVDTFGGILLFVEESLLKGKKILCILLISNDHTEHKYNLYFIDMNIEV